MSRGGVLTIDSGDFTMLKYIASLAGPDLERTVGYEKGRLKSGFLIVTLAEDEILSKDDFALASTTGNSGGVVKRLASGEPVGIEQILRDRSQDVDALKEKVARFFARRDGNTPAKVLPDLRHTEGMKYPNAEALGPGIRSGVPQFKLLKPKRFVIHRVEPAL